MAGACTDFGMVLVVFVQDGLLPKFFQLLLVKVE